MDSCKISFVEAAERPPTNVRFDQRPRRFHQAECTQVPTAINTLLPHTAAWSASDFSRPPHYTLITHGGWSAADCPPPSTHCPHTLQGERTRLADADNMKPRVERLLADVAADKAAATKYHNLGDWRLLKVQVGG
eukprot:359841-Chlamydomonas_euryale.AAC.6